MLLLPHNTRVHAQQKPSLPRPQQRWGCDGCSWTPNRFSGGCKDAGRAMEDASSLRTPLHQGPTTTQGPTADGIDTPIPFPCGSHINPAPPHIPPAPPFPEQQGQWQRGSVLTGLRRCGQREGREKRHLVRERQVSAPSPPAHPPSRCHQPCWSSTGGLPPPRLPSTHHLGPTSWLVTLVMGTAAARETPEGTQTPWNE